MVNHHAGAKQWLNKSQVAVNLWRMKFTEIFPFLMVAHSATIPPPGLFPGIPCSGLASLQAPVYIHR